MDMDTDFEQDLAKVIDNQRAQTVFNRWKMRTTKDRAESSSSIGSITETAAEVQESFLVGSKPSVLTLSFTNGLLCRKAGQ